MTDNWSVLLAEPIIVYRDGTPEILNTLDDARGLLTAHEPSKSEAELCQAAATAVSKAAGSGEASDISLATEQLKVLIRSLGWEEPRLDS